MKRLVEGMLPSEVLLKQGIYLQSCAHIELALWHIVQLADGHDMGEAPDIQRYIRLKKVTENLIKAVRGAIPKVPAPWGVLISVLIAKVDAGRENRNMAAHGAWYLTPEGKLEVEHYLLRPSDSGPVWHYIDQTFPMKQIDLALDEIDLLLRQAIYIRDTLRQRHIFEQRRMNLRCPICVRTFLTS